MKKISIMHKAFFILGLIVSGGVLLLADGMFASADVERSYVQFDPSAYPPAHSPVDIERTKIITYTLVNYIQESWDFTVHPVQYDPPVTGPGEEPLAEFTVLQANNSPNPCGPCASGNCFTIAPGARCDFDLEVVGNYLGAGTAEVVVKYGGTTHARQILYFDVTEVAPLEFVTPPQQHIPVDKVTTTPYTLKSQVEGPTYFAVNPAQTSSQGGNVNLAVLESTTGTPPPCVKATGCNGPGTCFVIRGVNQQCTFDLRLEGKALGDGAGILTVADNSSTTNLTNNFTFTVDKIATLEFINLPAEPLYVPSYITVPYTIQNSRVDTAYFGVIPEQTGFNGGEVDLTILATDANGYCKTAPGTCSVALCFALDGGKNCVFDLLIEGTAEGEGEARLSVYDNNQSNLITDFAFVVGKTAALEFIEPVTHIPVELYTTETYRLKNNQPDTAYFVVDPEVLPPSDEETGTVDFLVQPSSPGEAGEACEVQEGGCVGSTEGLCFVIDSNQECTFDLRLEGTSEGEGRGRLTILDSFKTNVALDFTFDVGKKAALGFYTPPPSSIVVKDYGTILYEVINNKPERLYFTVQPTQDESGGGRVEFEVTGEEVNSCLIVDSERCSVPSSEICFLIETGAWCDFTLGLQAVTPGTGEAMLALDYGDPQKLETTFDYEVEQPDALSFEGPLPDKVSLSDEGILTYKVKNNVAQEVQFNVNARQISGEGSVVFTTKPSTISPSCETIMTDCSEDNCFAVDAGESCNFDLVLTANEHGEGAGLLEVDYGYKENLEATFAFEVIEEIQGAWCRVPESPRRMTALTSDIDSNTQIQLYVAHLGQTYFGGQPGLVSSWDGIAWTLMSNGATSEDYPVLSLLSAESGRTGSRLFAGSDGVRAYDLQNHDEGWISLRFPFSTDIRSLVGYGAEEIFAATSQGVYTHRSGSDTWIAIGPDNANIQDLASTTPLLSLVAIDTENVYLRYLIEWVNLRLNSATELRSVAVDVNNEGVIRAIYVGAEAGKVYKNNMQGRWTETGSDIPSGDVIELYLTSNDVLYAGTSTGQVFLYNKDADTWQKVGHNEPASTESTLVGITMSKNGKLYAGNRNLGVYVFEPDRVSCESEN